jgi:hypothetical protein
MPIRPELRPLYRTPEYKAARAACRERAGDKCEACGGLNRAIGYRGPDAKFVRLAFGQAEKELLGVRLVLIQCGASHVNNVAGDDRPENLRCLCRGCHLAADKLFHKRTRQVRKDAARPLLTPEAWGMMFEKLAEGGTCAPREKEVST